MGRAQGEHCVSCTEHFPCAVSVVCVWVFCCGVALWTHGQPVICYTFSMLFWRTAVESIIPCFVFWSWLPQLCI